MRVRKKGVALVLAFVISASAVISSYQTAHASALAGSAALEFLYSLMMGTGMAIDLSSWFGKNDWGDLLDDPATQKQIDDANEFVKRMYDNATADWYKNHGGSLPSPTPVPDISPPVTVPPINPDDLAPLPWDDLKNNTITTGLLEMGAATYWCVKEAVNGLWDNIMGQVNLDSSIPAGAIDLFANGDYPYYMYYFNKKANCPFLWVISEGSFSVLGDKLYIFRGCKVYEYRGGWVIHQDNSNATMQTTTNKNFASGDSWRSNVPDFTTFEDGMAWRGSLPDINKEDLWVNPDLKEAYDNGTSPNLPDTVPPVIQLPTLDELKDLMNQGKGNEKDRPVIVENFITNHYVYPDVTPKPTTAPDPTSAPKPTTVPKPSGRPEPTGLPDNPDTPDNPDDSDMDIEDVKTDLRLVFPFCIPFDLIHLFEVLDAEPEAPVFKIPIDFEFTNPWTQETIIDYHETFEIDIGKLEPVVKLFRLFQVIFFIVGLMMITRQHMIKG
ncbi:MAG: hypothetical protein Q4D16_21930 [Eubacteriales bacterium]|nr:hypothetical protein [Eubacteriales bacterium]